MCIRDSLCNGFREYLLNARQLKNKRQRISLNSASGYFSTFRGLLKIAYRDKWIRENINDYLDKIEPEQVKKEYLTLEELKQLAATPCEIDVLKRASLFSCLTGLRISDILNLRWEDIVPVSYTHLDVYKRQHRYCRTEGNLGSY